jgi:preprotein translocase subunit SecE
MFPGAAGAVPEAGRIVFGSVAVGGPRVAQVSEKEGGAGQWLRNVPTFVNQVRAETEKVVWPSRRETVMTAVMVVAMTMVLGIFFFSVDWGFSRIVRFLLSLA